MQQNFDAHTPLSNTGVTQRANVGCPDLDEYDEIIQRGWTEESWLSAAPVSGRVVRGDGINLQLPPDCLEEFKKFIIEDFLGVDSTFDLLPRSGSKDYEDRYEGPFGISILARPYSESNCGKFKCDFLGKTSAHLSLAHWRKLILWVDEHGGYASMLHFDIDDYQKEVTPEMMYAAIHQPGGSWSKWSNGMSKGVVGFKTYKYHESSNKIGVGRTIEFGKKGKKAGQKQYCCYDKKAESDGEFDCIRHELRVWKKKSRHLFSMLAETAKYPDWEELWLEQIVGVILGAVDFLDVSNYDPELGKLEDCPRFKWWEDFITNRSIIKLPAKKKNHQSFRAKVKYLRKQIAPTLACVLNCFAQLKDGAGLAEAFFWELWFLGEEKMNKAQRRIQAEHKAMYCKT